MHTHKHTLIAPLVLAVALGLVGCSSPDDSGLESTPPPETAEPAPEADDETADQDATDDEATDTSDADLDDVTRAALAALDLAEAEAGGQAFHIDDEDDKTAWEVEVNAQGEEFDVVVNWAGSEVQSSTPDGAVDSDTIEKLGGSTLTIQEAIHIAGAEAQGSLEDAEIDREDSIIVWEVTFDDGTTDTDVRIDANTGEVLKVEVD